MDWMCPKCKQPLAAWAGGLHCRSCRSNYETVAGIPDLRIDCETWIDRASARRLPVPILTFHSLDDSRSVISVAPDIFRQRLLVEGYFTAELDAGAVSVFLVELAGALGLRTYSEPIVHSTDVAIDAGMGRPENAGFDAFVPLVDSGIAAYFWTQPKFFSVVIYTCAAFDEDRAVAFTREALAVEGKTVHAGF